MHEHFVKDTVFWLQNRKYCHVYVYWI
jgi:hypothetical protein